MHYYCALPRKQLKKSKFKLNLNYFLVFLAFLAIRFDFNFWIRFDFKSWTVDSGRFQKLEPKTEPTVSLQITNVILRVLHKKLYTPKRRYYDLGPIKDIVVQSRKIWNSKLAGIAVRMTTKFVT